MGAGCYAKRHGRGSARSAGGTNASRTRVTSSGMPAPVRALMAATLGLMIALVGADPVTGAPRLTFDQSALFEGVDFIPVAIGVFGIA